MRFISLLLVFAMLLSFTACVNTDTPPADTDPADVSSDDPTSAEDTTEAPRELTMEEMLLAACDTEISYKEIPEFRPTDEHAYIQAITYDGANIGEDKTKVFAYIGFPEMETDEKIPAVILIHGGGGVPYLSWIKMWNDRGYAAIAMSTTGHFPKNVNAGKTETSNDLVEWNHGLYGVFAEDGYANAPDNDSMANSEAPYEEQWMYHAVTQVIHAGNILRADDRIDPEKIGMIGISWGGVITALTITYDTSYAFAVPIYGSGYLAEALTYFGPLFSDGKNPEIWLAENRFENVDIPVLWLCANADRPFSLNSNSKSYVDTVKNNPDTRFSAINGWSHSHANGWKRLEDYLFAESVVRDADRPATIVIRDGEPVIENPDNTTIKSVKLYYITEPLRYENERMAESWKVTLQTYKDGELTVSVPENAKLYYFEVTSVVNEKNFIATSELLEQ